MKKIITIFLFIIIGTKTFCQLPPIFEKVDSSLFRPSEIGTIYLTPSRIVWLSDTTLKFILNAKKILEKGNGQADLSKDPNLTLINSGNVKSSIILDFGAEIHGGISIIGSRANSNPAGKIRIRFGESVSETMSEIGQNGSTNDHAIRDFEVIVPRMGKIEIGDTGFRFVRIDFLDENAELQLKEISAIFKFREINYLGSFESNDELLNKIWITGAYTVHLNMQDYLWDGIKRDRLVWVGDMHPEIMTINSVFGYNPIVPKSLDYIKDSTPLPNYMNRISSYSLWWIIIQRDWYLYQGDFNYLLNQKDYLFSLLKLLATKIDKNGSEILDGERFLDWPTNDNFEAIHAGLQALLLMSFEAGYELSFYLNDKESINLCKRVIKKLKNHVPVPGNSKQAAALLSLSGLLSPNISNQIISRGEIQDFSTFYGYYMLNAKAKAKDYHGALNNIRNYWGAMLELGATTFWEDFDINWMKNAGRINEIVPENKIDVHGTYGNYGYKGFRHSLCHGWASGPTSWLTTNILGVNILEPGCKKIKLDPHLEDLKWVKGTFPTPFGILKIEHKKQEDGSIITTYEKPPQIEIISN